nr:MAG TPA: hypothetical protein [Caudoviricetes sp.]
MIICEPKSKKVFLIMTDDSLSDILVDLSQLLINLTSYDGLDDNDMLLNIVSMLNRNYSSLTTVALIVKSKIKALEGEHHDCI